MRRVGPTVNSLGRGESAAKEVGGVLRGHMRGRSTGDSLGRGGSATKEVEDGGSGIMRCVFDSLFPLLVDVLTG
uniref:Uncharacterized protein n=1 Tax=Oryza punctata TaxID=4537 RepID=A0A0E0KMQ4_ORYPU